MLKINEIFIKKMIINSKISLDSILIDTKYPLVVKSEHKDIISYFMKTIFNYRKSAHLIKTNNILINDYDKSRFEISSFNDFYKKAIKSKKSFYEFLTEQLEKSYFFDAQYNEFENQKTFELNYKIFESNNAHDSELSQLQIFFEDMKENKFQYYENEYKKYNHIYDKLEFMMKFYKEYRKATKQFFINRIINFRNPQIYKNIDMKKYKKDLKIELKNVFKNPVFKHIF